MKKRFVAMLAALLWLLVACGQTAPATTVVSSVSADTQQTGKAVGAGFRMATSPDFTCTGSGNAEGFYSVVANDDGSKNILYTDYASASQVYLCNQPNCEHDSEKCTAWVAPFEGSVTPVATENNLFLIYSGTTQNAKIEQMGLNGENKKIIFTFSQQAVIENAVAANDQFLVFSVCSYQQDDDGGVEPQYNLVALELQTQKMKTLFSLAEHSDKNKAENKAMFFKGVTNTGFIVETMVQNAYETDETSVEKTFENMNNATTHTVYEIPFDGSAPQPLLTYANNQCNGMPYGDAFFYVKKKENGLLTLLRLKTDTQETTVLADDFAKQWLGEEKKEMTVDDVVFRNFVDGYLLMNVLTDEYVARNEKTESMELVFTGVAVDPDSKEMKTIGLTSHYNATTVPADILAQAGDKLLVFASVLPQQDPGFRKGAVARKVALISKADYLQSVANFTMVNLLREYW